MRSTQVAAAVVIILTLVGVGIFMMWTGQLRGRANQIDEYLPQLEAISGHLENATGDSINVEGMENYRDQVRIDSEIWFYLAVILGGAGTVTSVALYTHKPEENEEDDYSTLMST